MFVFFAALFATVQLLCSKWRRRSVRFFAVSRQAAGKLKDFFAMFALVQMMFGVGGCHVFV